MSIPEGDGVNKLRNKRNFKPKKPEKKGMKKLPGPIILHVPRQKVHRPVCACDGDMKKRNLR